MTALPAEAIAFFTGSNHTATNAVPVEGGLINASWKLEFGNGENLFLQLINTSVFTAPGTIQKNLLQLVNHFDRPSAGFQLPAPVLSTTGESLFCDAAGNFWRAFRFIENTVSYPAAPDPAFAQRTAIAFAKFTRAFHSFDAGQLQPVIPGFHNLRLRYEQFTTAWQHLDIADTDAAETGAALLERKIYPDLYDKIVAAPGFALRVMHHDAKIANVLFNRDNGELAAVIDLDTVMPGYFFSDAGDMIRSMAGGDENSHNINQVQPAFYKAITENYLSIMEGLFSKEELDYFHCSGLLMVYMQAIRFLTDHLNGDIYYKTAYRGQNLERARNQYQLLCSLEAYVIEAGLVPADISNTLCNI